jgi:hypothetical protein
MSSGSFWSDACKHMQGRPLHALLDAAHASCGATVRKARSPATMAALFVFGCLPPYDALLNRLPSSA